MLFYHVILTDNALTNTKRRNTGIEEWLLQLVCINYFLFELFFYYFLKIQ